MSNFFQQFNSYYHKIYVLSVLAAKERRERFARNFEGLNYEFFYGADKSTFSVEELEEKGIYSSVLTSKHHRMSRNMKPGEIACSWSHRLIYEDMLAKGYERVMIFEDDAVPNSQMLPHISNIFSEIPSNLEILMWGWGKNGETNAKTAIKQAWYHIQHRMGMLKWNHTMINNLFARPYSTWLKSAGFHDYTYAYSITRSAAQKLLNMQTPIQYIADNLLAHAITTEVIKGYTCFPACFLHDSLPDGSPRDSFIRENQS